jgi:hypothetical protein
MKELQLAVITPANFPVLQECATKVPLISNIIVLMLVCILIYFGVAVKDQLFRFSNILISSSCFRQLKLLQIPNQMDHT